MSTISAAAVKTLRDRTNQPMMDCKAALTEASGDMDKAVEILRKRGKDVADKKGGRETAEGRIAAFIDPFGRITARLRGRERKDLFEEGILVTEVPLSERQTFYTRYGDIFAYLQILFCGLLLFHARMQGKIYTLNDAKVTE